MTLSPRTSRPIAALLLAGLMSQYAFAADRGRLAARSNAPATAMTETVLSGVPSGKYTLDKSHAYINFTYSHLGFSTPSVGFKEFDVALTLDNENLNNSKLEVTIDIDSIDSRVAKFDKHLVGDDMFDTANYPTATFKSTAFTMTSASTVDVTGDLTIKDTTRPVTLNATINKAAVHPMRKVPAIGVSATTRFKRSDFGISYATPHVGDDVSISIEVELPQAK